MSQQLIIKIKSGIKTIIFSCSSYYIIMSKIESNCTDNSCFQDLLRNASFVVLKNPSAAILWRMGSSPDKLRGITIFF